MYVFFHFQRIPSLAAAMEEVRSIAVASVNAVLSEFGISADIVDSCPYKEAACVSGQSGRRRRRCEENVLSLLGKESLSSAGRDIGDLQGKENLGDALRSQHHCNGDVERGTVFEKNARIEGERRHLVEERAGCDQGEHQVFTVNSEDRSGMELSRQLVSDVEATNRRESETTVNNQEWSLPKDRQKVLFNLRTLLSSRRLLVGKWITASINTIFVA